MKNYELSLSPIDLGIVKLKNKIVFSPISLNMAKKNGEITDNIINFFTNIAKNNVGLIIVGNACVSDIGKGLKTMVLKHVFKLHIWARKEIQNTLGKE